jgi:hypothetical protein
MATDLGLPISIMEYQLGREKSPGRVYSPWLRGKLY